MTKSDSVWQQFLIIANEILVRLKSNSGTNAFQEVKYLSRRLEEVRPRGYLVDESTPAFRIVEVSESNDRDQLDDVELRHLDRKDKSFYGIAELTSQDPWRNSHTVEMLWWTVCTGFVERGTRGEKYKVPQVEIRTIDLAKSKENAIAAIKKWIRFAESGPSLVEGAEDPNSESLRVTKEELNRLLVSPMVQALLRDESVVWPNAVEKPNGKPHKWVYQEVRDAIANSSRSDRKYLLSKLPANESETRQLLVSVPKS